MDPLPIPHVSACPSRCDEDSRSAEEARRDARRNEQSKASAFRQAMQRTGGTFVTGGQLPPGSTATANVALPPSGPATKGAPSGTTGAIHPALARQDQALSPSLLKLRAGVGRAAAPTTTTSKSASPQPTTVEGRPLPANPEQSQPAELSAGGMTPLTNSGRRDNSPALSPALQVQAMLNTSSVPAESLRVESRGTGRDGYQNKDDPRTSDEAPASESASDGTVQPLPAATFTPPPAETPVAPEARVLPPTPLLNQVVEYATVAPNQQGFMEFRLGLTRNALGGMRIRVCAYGNRRIGLNVQGGEGEGAIDDAQLSGLIDALRRRGVEVVNTVFD